MNKVASNRIPNLSNRTMDKGKQKESQISCNYSDTNKYRELVIKPSIVCPAS